MKTSLFQTILKKTRISLKMMQITKNGKFVKYSELKGKKNKGCDLRLKKLKFSEEET